MHESCGGNPLFVLSLASRLAQDIARDRAPEQTKRHQMGLTPTPEELPGARRLDGLLLEALGKKYIPSSLNEIVLAQLDRLTMQVLLPPSPRSSCPGASAPCSVRCSSPSLPFMTMQESLIIKMAATVVFPSPGGARFERSVLRGIYP